MKNLLFIVSILFSLDACGGSSFPAVNTVVTPPPSGSPITASLVPARTSGVAPLSVFFDASATTDSALTCDTATGFLCAFHQLKYTWNFAESGAGNWSYGSGLGSRNTATGPMAAHVFETPGTYVVNQTITDGTNSVTTPVTITVSDPETVFATTATTCVSTSGTFTGCPSGANHVTTSNFNTAIGNISSSVKRILFNRGETWTEGTSATVSQAGPGLIGVYGTGAKPIITASAAISMLHFSANDWRVVDVVLDGGSHGAYGIASIGGSSQITVLRIDVNNTYGAFSTDNGTVDRGPNSDQYTIQDSSLSLDLATPAGNVGSWILASRLSYQGNNLDMHGAGEHVLRFPKVIGGVISNNTLANPGPSGKECLKLHSANDGNAPHTFDGTYTEKVEIADNHFVANATTDTQLFIAPQNTSSDERLRNLVIERNWFDNGATSGSYALEFEATLGATSRNNIFTAGPHGAYITNITGVSGTIAANDLIYIYNNTTYGTTGGSPLVGVLLAGDNTLRVTIRNNLTVNPNATAYSTWNTFTGTLTADHNLASSSASTLFSTNPPTVTSDFALKVGGAAIGYGVAVPVLDDFIRATRATTWDAGAYKY